MQKKLTSGFKWSLILVTVLLLSVSLFFGARDIPVELLKTKYANNESKFIKVDDIDVHYKDEGERSDTLPVILLHGTGASLHTFDAWTTHLEPNRRVIRIDLPGFGLTGPFKNADYSIEAYVQLLHEFLKEIKIEQCIIAGNSLGGQIAWNYTIKYPTQIKKLILIDAAGIQCGKSTSPMAFKIARIPILNKLLTYITPKFVIRNSIESVYHDQSKVTDDIVNRYFDLTLRAGNRQAVIDRLTHPNNESDFDIISSIYQPTLIIWGENDHLFNVGCAQKFDDLLPNSTLLIIPKCGHVPMEECPEATYAVTDSFLNQ